MAKEFKMGPGAGPQQAQLNINPDDLVDVLCEKCDNQTFIQVYLFKSLSAVLSPSGKKTIVPMQVFKCDDCGHINEDFLPTSSKK